MQKIIKVRMKKGWDVMGDEWKRSHGKNCAKWN
jgi:hypothetical protein